MLIGLYGGLEQAIRTEKLKDFIKLRLILILLTDLFVIVFGNFHQ